MKDPSTHIRQIQVDEACLERPYTKQILERADTIPVAVVKGQGLCDLFQEPYPKNLHDGKKILFLTENKGHFFKPCPATREYRCCDYQVLNIGMNCPMDCVYCILQAYLNNPWLSFFVNIGTLLEELSRSMAMEPERFLRIGTGEFTDSMALDRLTGLSPILINFMATKPNAILELKTKSAMIDNLKGLDHQGRTVISWSLNSPAVMAREELRTATLEERLEAASLCASWGYRLAFHFDPIIEHPDWQQGYSETISRLYEAVPADKIAWISLGALRYLPHLKNIAIQRFPTSRFFYNEFITGLDGKSRYFRTLRVEMYRHLYEELAKKADANTCIYLCMESDEIWQEAFGFTPQERGGLPAMLDMAAGICYR